MYVGLGIYRFMRQKVATVLEMEMKKEDSSSPSTETTLLIYGQFSPGTDGKNMDNRCPGLEVQIPVLVLPSKVT